jgi:hypothetical protein
MGFSLGSFFDPAGITTGNSGSNLGNLFDPGGGIMDTLGIDMGGISDWRDQSADYFDSMADFEMSQLSDWGKKFRKNPEQLFLGAGDPLSTKAWNGVLGTDYTPFVNQYGGPTNESYQSAEDKGVDTSNARGSHQVAQTVASYYGGQALGDLAGAAYGAVGPADSLGAVSGTGANFAGAVGAGGGIGAANALNAGTDVWSGFGKGALSGALGSGFDYGGAMGLENPMYKRALNSTLTGGLQASASGEDFGKGAGKGFIGAAAPMLAQQGGSMLGNMFGGSQEAGMEYDPTAGGGFGGTATANAGETGYSPKSFMGANNNDGAAAFEALGGIASGGASPSSFSSASSSGVPSSSGGSPVADFISSFVGGGGGGKSGTGNYGNMAASLFGLHNAYQQKKRLKGQVNQLNSLFAPNSPYAQQMRQRMERKDAAAGRRSQYGPREAQLMAQMAEMNSRNAPMINQMSNAMGGLDNSMVNNGLQLGNQLYRNAPQMGRDLGSLWNMFSGGGQ